MAPTTTMTTALPTTEQARSWLRRWDDQQATYFTDREERFEVICDLLAETLGRPDPLIVDLGVGPGSLSQRILQRLPRSRIVGADMDPLLLGLAERAYGGPRFRVVQADLRAEGWLDRLQLDARPDAFVSTTALHWLERAPLQRLLTAAARALEPGGVVIDGDHLYETPDCSGLDELARRLAERTAVRTGRTDAEDWATWWQAVAEAPELADLWAQRVETDLSHTVRERPTVQDYLYALRAGGCTEAGQLWQVGHDRIILGRRSAD